MIERKINPTSTTTITVLISNLGGGASRTRELILMLGASILAVILFSSLALLGVPLQELDKWMLLLSVPWFIVLYALCRLPFSIEFGQISVAWAATAAAVITVSEFLVKVIASLLPW